ncbi:MAG: toll/interleukin-1 receptor domain-containing protein [Lachnospiraceae bacterium]|nr:toll/interleukin-1 receptor domain-containing protein [Lachnospiraceae bacterium]
MKIFVSWSGDLSRKVAEVLKKWIPCLLQSVEVFFSPEDIEKGDNWDRTISTQLSECKYGIICLTSENTSAPWINFEAGAIAKTLDSRVVALMIDIKPSDIRGPISRYQATKLEKDDFYQLILSINKTLEAPLDDKILENAFKAMWPALETDVNQITSQFATSNNKQKKSAVSEPVENAPIEEVLQLLRKQNSILSSPGNLLPVEYMEQIQNRMLERRREMDVEDDMIGEEVLNYLRMIVSRVRRFSGPAAREIFELLNFDELMRIFLRYARRKNNEQLYKSLRWVRMELRRCLELRDNTTEISAGETDEWKVECTDL